MKCWADFEVWHVCIERYWTHNALSKRSHLPYCKYISTTNCRLFPDTAKLRLWLWKCKATSLGKLGTSQSAYLAQLPRYYSPMLCCKQKDRVFWLAASTPCTVNPAPSNYKGSHTAPSYSPVSPIYIAKNIFSCKIQRTLYYIVLLSPTVQSSVLETS